MRSAVAPGSASLRPPAGAPLSISVSTLSVGDLVRELTAAPGPAVLIRQGPRTLAGGPSHRALPPSLPALSAPVPVEGEDEFAALGHEFNRMSGELEQRLAELSQERARLRESLVRVGQTFASNLDRRRLLERAPVWRLRRPPAARLRWARCRAITA